MEYFFEKKHSGYEDFASGRVLYNARGTTAFPVRLASEIIQRCSWMDEALSNLDAKLRSPCSFCCRCSRHLCREALTFKNVHVFINIWYINELFFCQRKNKIGQMNAWAVLVRRPSASLRHARYMW
ncbi:hypothetical protein ABD76_23525 [Paenibacillus dendritiformis]|uniref:hypothetical protein n=1 Tax=Paenibacillus dendritiformis TaxID=130049 RepID=UPI001F558421|nr:hypothetical protein [Paenibacillus dendritiformis]MBG9795269.1 hypothetical protein [Paenibacillus dendritiformis]